MELLTPVDKRELKLALLNAYGVSWEELKEMDHYDLDDSELDGWDEKDRSPIGAVTPVGIFFWSKKECLSLLESHIYYETDRANKKSIP